MRILFLATNVRTHHPCEMYPIGVGALSAYFKQKGHEVRCFTATRVSQFRGLERVLQEFQPQFVGYSVISCQSPNIPIFAAMVKRWNPDVPFVCGGAYPSMASEQVLAIRDVDAVCIGDGEFSLEELLDGLERGEWNTSIDGFWFKAPDGSIIRNELRPFIQDLDSLPYVDRECVDFQHILDDNTGVLWMLASRGCQWDCTFCGISRLKKRGKGRYTRNRSVDHVLGELREIMGRFRFKVIIFRDDTFTWNRGWTLEFMEKYAREFTYPLAIFSRSDCLDEEVVAAMKRANCQSVWMGFESGNDYLRNTLIRKQIDKEQFIETCDLLNRYDVRPIVLNIVGLPYETPEMFQETIEVNRRIHANHPFFSLGSGTGPKVFAFEPFPGTQLYDLCEQNGWVRMERLKPGFRAHMDTHVDIPTFPKEQVRKQFRRFRYNVYKGNQNLYALFYLLYDSVLGEMLLEIVSSRLLRHGINLILGAQKNIPDVPSMEMHDGSDDELSVTVTRSIPAPAADVWREMVRPGHLNDCHPFCASNVPERWPGVGSRDEVRFHNGKVLYRNFLTWDEGSGYLVTVTDEADSEVADVSFSVSPADGNGHSTMSISVSPRFNSVVPPFVRRALWELGMRQLNAYYFSCVLKGFEYHISTGHSVRPNQFGWHPQYS